MVKRISAKRAYKLLLNYQEFFNIKNESVSAKREYQRAIYVLRTLLRISWNQETDKYLGNIADKKLQRLES